MSKFYLTVFLVGMFFLAKAQNRSEVEKSVIGIQTGYLGAWAHHEAKLANKIALRTEVGLLGDLIGGNYWNDAGSIWTPVLSLEPRWYYNISKRASRLKKTKGNSANFLSINGSFYPDWFVLSKYDKIQMVNQISIVPTWGIRRVVWSHFTVEAGIGIGYRYVFAKNAGYPENNGELAGNLHLRFGYIF
ncbi:hypothetical protein [Echinicola salinicaeni]|uniref:hypothetical protein n=1 Tax=Echinicola salinicaeni TaxID=2762757 RepID=UPI0016458882|nr:hypothetical protein [Echinicola salinicaeni]